MNLNDAAGEMEYTALKISTAIRNKDFDEAYSLLEELRCQSYDLEDQLEQELEIV